MNMKLTALTSGILVCLSTAVSADPPAPPSIYATGPTAPLLNTTDLTASEKSAFALLEGVMQVTEAQIHATTCAPASYAIEIYADGSVNNEAANPEFNQVQVLDGNGSMAPQFSLVANVLPAVTGRGQQVQVSLFGSGTLGPAPYTSAITSYNATYVYNNVNNLLVSNNSTTSLVGINGGIPDIYSGQVIKDFYRGDNVNSSDPLYYDIIDWGLQSVSKLNYPVNKWWQRSTSHRDDGVVGRLVWVKDRLVGASSCRITIDTNGYDNLNYFWQGGAIGAGTLTISTNKPSDPVEPDVNGVQAWDQAPF